MNKRTISSIILPRIPAGLLIRLKAVETCIATGKMAAVPYLTTPDAPSAGNSPAMPFHPREMSRNKTMINGG
jgi:hypothetical protein